MEKAFLFPNTWQEDLDEYVAYCKISSDVYNTLLQTRHRNMFLNVDEKHETESLGCQANRFSHVVTDESYRKFYLINNILLKMWFNSLSVNKNSVEIQWLFKIHFYWISFQSLGSKPPVSIAASSNLKHKSIANETYWHNGMSLLRMHFPPFLQYPSGQSANIKVKIVISPYFLLHLLSDFQNVKIFTLVLLSA